MRPQPVTLAHETAQPATLAGETPQRIEQGWIAAMPEGIADKLFGVPVGSLVTFFAEPGKITAMMNLALQTEEARSREPGWILEMPADIAAASDSAEGSLMVVYAKAGALRVEIIARRPEIKERVRRMVEQYKEAFDEMKRLGD